MKQLDKYALNEKNMKSCIQFNTRNRIFLFDFWIVFLIFGCQSHPIDSDDIMSITIDVNRNKVTYHLSEITEKVDVIELETNDN